MKQLIKVSKVVRAVLPASSFWGFMCNRPSVLEVVILWNFNDFTIEEQKDNFLSHFDSCG